MATEQNKMTQDEALAEKLADLLGIKSPSGSDRKATEELVEVASELRKEVIDPAVISGSLKLLEAHRNALYDAFPNGAELDAMDMLNIVQTHLQHVDASIASLKNSLKPVEVLQKEQSAKPLERMAQEAEVVEDEDAAA